jgi:transcriptional regulator with XRE-family HTH domain
MSVDVRFTLLLKKIKKTANALSKDIGVTPPTIKKIEKGETSPSGTVLTFLIKEYSLNANWLLTGQGSMFINTDNSASQKIINGDNSQTQIGDNSKNTINSNNSNTTEVEYLKSKVELLEKSLKDKERIISMLEKD